MTTRLHETFRLLDTVCGIEMAIQSTNASLYTDEKFTLWQRGGFKKYRCFYFDQY